MGLGGLLLLCVVAAHELTRLCSLRSARVSTHASTAASGSPQALTEVTEVKRVRVPIGLANIRHAVDPRAPQPSEMAPVANPL